MAAAKEVASITDKNVCMREICRTTVVTERTCGAGGRPCLCCSLKC